MTRAEAVRAATARVPIKTCGATARMHGEIVYSRIQRVSFNVDNYGDPYYTADLIEQKNGRVISVTVCDIKDIKLTDDVPDTLKRMVYKDSESIQSSA